MLAAVFGDTHGNIRLLFSRALAWEERTGLSLDVIFQVGDFGIWPNPTTVDHSSRKFFEMDHLPAGGDFSTYALGKRGVPLPLYFIRGNHEDQLFLRAHERIHMALYPEDYLTRAIEICPNLHYLPDGHIVNIGGWKFAAWGGNFAKKTWENNLGYWDPKLHGRRLNHMTRDVFERLLHSEFDVLLTHDAPIGSGVVGAVGVELPEEEMTGGGCAPIKELIEVVAPKYQFNGHWHEFHYNQFANSSQLGYPTKAFVLDKVDPHYPETHCLEVFEICPTVKLSPTPS